MTKEEKIIATAFTGIMFLDGSDMGSLYEYMEKKVGHGVIDLTLTSKEFWEELHKACEQDFIDMISKEQPSLPSNLDEAANTFGFKETHKRLMEGGITRKDERMFRWQIEKAFKAGAEWMAGQGEAVTGIVTKVGDKLDVETTEYLTPEESEFERGDRVVIQIRKRQ